MPKYTLTYFNGKGRAETVRVLFAVAGVPYEDKRVDFTQWQELKPTTPLGQLPILTVEGQGTIAQSMAIARFVAKELGLAGKSPYEAAVIDSLSEGVTEVREKAAEMAFEKDETRKKTLRDGFKDKYTPIFKALEKHLTANNGGTGYFVGTEITLVDVHFFVVLEFLKGINPAVLDEFPKLKGLYERLAAHPKIADHVKHRPQTEH